MNGVKGDIDMESYVMKTCTVSASFDEEVNLNSALSDFSKALFEEGFVNVQTLYDKETGRLYRELSISVNKKEEK
jgi:hypothetical protein